MAPDESHEVVFGLDGTRLFVRHRQGTHPSDSIHAFFSDGILCDGFIWKYLWDDLAAMMPLTHSHYRGHGRSAPPQDPSRVDIPSLADDLWCVRRDVGGPPAVLFGHSMGCQVALEEYRRHPEGVRALVLLCGTFGGVTKTFRGTDLLDQFLPRIARAVKKNATLARALWTRIPEGMAINIAVRAGELDPARLNPDDVKPYIAHMKSVDFPMFVNMLSAAGEHSAEDILGQIRVPTLVIAGERDTWTPAFLAEKMANSIPNADLLMVEGGTHVAPIERRESINAAILSFLRRRVLTA